MSDTKKDSEDLFNTQDDSNTNTIVGALGMRTIKISIFLFVLFILICSDVFVDRLLSTHDNRYVIGRQCTEAGVIVQGLLLSIGFICINILVSCDYI